MYWTLDTWRWAPFVVNEEGDGVGPLGWKPPVGAFSCLDLRTFAECGTPGHVGVPGRYGVFVSTDVPLTGTILSDDPRGTLTTKNKRMVFDTLGVQVAVSMLDDYLWELMNVHADNVRICKPLLPKTGFELELLCGPLVKRMQTGKGGPGWDNLVKQRQADYAAMKVSDPDFAQRLLSKWEESYPGSAFTDFIPAGLPVIEPLPHQTTITESFNGADKAGLGYDLTWTEVSGTGDYDNYSNTARSINQLYPNAYARAESDLSSSDHYAQVDHTVAGPGTAVTYVGTATRFASAASTMYWGVYTYGVDGATKNHYIGKIVTGTRTNLADAYDGNASIGQPQTLKMVSNGTALEFFRGGVSKVSVTDSALSTGTRCGLLNLPQLAGDQMDAWSAADLAAASGNPWYAYAQQ